MSVGAGFQIANDSNYGLGGSVWWADEGRALDLARRVRTGTIGLNYYNIDLGAHLGGMKDSGIGRELGTRRPQQLPGVQVDLRERRSAEQLSSSRAEDRRPRAGPGRSS
jgi:acyl-CoA reductase-like NAD-dependent aldehyde dehydrogenase